ncbi:hypothetical protein AN958_01580 [Leucoagaricus sp. SymC.cos]|nr:hypothetical protein AN958_01580 [Leucoagaricus sp. SymC.cos]
MICQYYIKEPYHTSVLSGEAWVNELLNGHSEQIWTELGVYAHVFWQLIHELYIRGYWGSCYVSLEEQLVIFLYVSVTGLTIHNTGECFQQANATISM